MLRFERDSMASSGKLVARVHLNAGLGGVDVEDAATFRIAKCRGKPDLAVGIVAQHEVVVVTVAKTQLFVVVVDTRADALRACEVERGTVNWPDLTCRDQRVVYGGEVTRAHGQLMTQDVGRH